MSIRITRDKTFFKFEPGLTPVTHVKPGNEIVFETHDCLHGQIRN